MCLYNTSASACVCRSTVDSPGSTAAEMSDWASFTLRIASSISREFATWLSCAGFTMQFRACSTLRAQAQHSAHTVTYVAGNSYWTLYIHRDHAPPCTASTLRAQARHSAHTFTYVAGNSYWTLYIHRDHTNDSRLIPSSVMQEQYNEQHRWHCIRLPMFTGAYRRGRPLKTMPV